MRWMWGAIGLMVAVGATVPARGDLVTLNYWDASLNYGVFADGGSMPTPIQGPVQMAPGGVSLAWERIDGVAQARASVQYQLNIDSGAGELGFNVDLSTSASAQVGMQPEYPAARGIAETWFEYALFDFTLAQPAWLTVVGEALGPYEPGVHRLDAGDYVLEMRGPDGRSWVDVGPLASAVSDNRFVASFQVSSVPAPGAMATLVACGFLGARRDRAGRRRG